MKIVGIDLAGKQSNPTGYTLLTTINKEKTISSTILQNDEEILEKINADKPDLVAIDAPLTYRGEKRVCDELLQHYGVLPPILPGMQVLAERGTQLAKKLGGKNIDYIEVSVRSSGKILGVTAKDEFTYQKNLTSLDLSGDINNKIYNKDELDAAVAALTGFLHLQGETKSVGGDDGVIIIPDI